MRGASLPTADDNNDAAMAPPASKDRKDMDTPLTMMTEGSEDTAGGKDPEMLGPMADEEVRNDEKREAESVGDVARERDPEGWEGVEGKKVEVSMEDLAWQMLPYFGPATPWQAVSDKEDVARLEPQQPITA